jgi:hypothetical protein
MISVECGVRVVQFIGICHWRLFGTSRVMPILAKFIFVLQSDPQHCQDAHIEPGQIPGRALLRVIDGCATVPVLL